MAENVELMIKSGAASASMSLSDVPETDIKKDQTSKPNTIATVTYIVAAVCAVLSIGSLATAPGNWVKYIIYVAFIISICTSTTVSVQRFFLTKMETLREVMNNVRETALNLQYENNELVRKNQELEEEVKKVQDIEKQLSDVCSAQGQSVDTFVSLVKENAGILKEIKVQMKAQVLNDFMNVVLSSDRDEDFTIDPNEVGALIFRLESQAGVKIDKEKFKAELEKRDYKISGVMELAKDLADDNTAVFTIDPEKSKT